MKKILLIGLIIFLFCSATSPPKNLNKENVKPSLSSSLNDQQLMLQPIRIGASNIDEFAILSVQNQVIRDVKIIRDLNKVVGGEQLFALNSVPTVEGLDAGEKVSLFVSTTVSLDNPIPVMEVLDTKKV